jgi:hypothetical protein
MSYAIKVCEDGNEGLYPRIYSTFEKADKDRKAFQKEELYLYNAEYISDDYLYNLKYKYPELRLYIVVRLEDI